MLPTILLIFVISLNAFCTFGMTYYVWKIYKLKVTPEYTWSLKLAACIIQAFLLLFGLLFINETLHFVQTLPPISLLVSYAMGAIRSALLFVFVLNVWKTLEVKFPPA